MICVKTKFGLLSLAMVIFHASAVKPAKLEEIELGYLGKKINIAFQTKSQHLSIRGLQFL